MQSRFTFLEDNFPKLADYGRKAEECSSYDYNICLLNLGRMAEFIAFELCRKNGVPIEGGAEDIAQRLADMDIITEEISRKITTLTEIKHDAANDDYDSEMACSRLMAVAEELCRWFMSYHSEGKFAFMGELYPPDKPLPILMNFAELGREAEENLFTNTRYCIICLGDMGEAAADRLITGNAIETHEKDQIDRIDILSDKYIIPKEIKDILHDLRIARNKTIHERYNDKYTSTAQGIRLIDEALTLCEWLFRLTIKPGYVVKAKITGENDSDFSASCGVVPMHVPKSEIPEGRTCITGKKYVFKVIDSDDSGIILSLTSAENDYNLSVGRLYAKYKPGQDVHVKIKSMSNSTGAIVELRDGLEARIPKSEIGRELYRYDDESHEKIIRYETTARVKWFSLTEYPPMLLSVKDIEDEQSRPHEEPPSPPKQNPAMSDLDFRVFCRSATYEAVIQALDEGANPNATNNNNTTALMMAAQYNSNPRVIRALIDAGAGVNVHNHKGNTALMYAAMSNTPEAVQTILDAGADITAVNGEGKKAADFAATNRKLNDTEIMRILRGDDDISANVQDDSTEAETASEAQQDIPEITQNDSQQDYSSQPDTPGEVQRDIHEITQSDSQQDYSTEADTPGEAQRDIHEITQDTSQQNESTQPDMPSEAQRDIPEITQDTSQQDYSTESDTPGETQQDIPENTQEEQMQDMSPENEDYSNDEEEYYEIEAPETHGHDDNNDRPLTQEQEEESRKVLRMTLQKDFLKICRSGAEEDITQAISAGVNVNVTNKTASTALMFAAQSNTAGVIDILIQAGADVNAQDDNGNTALIYAASYNTDDAVDALINAGADSGITNNDGHKAADYARHNYRLSDTDIISRL